MTVQNVSQNHFHVFQPALVTHFLQ